MVTSSAVDVFIQAKRTLTFIQKILRVLLVVQVPDSQIAIFKCVAKRNMELIKSLSSLVFKAPLDNHI